MYSIKRTITRCRLVLLNLIYISPVFAAEEATPQQYPWPWWPEAHGHAFWWIFPLMFFVLMIVFCFLFMRRGGMGCMWRDWMIDRPEYRETTQQSRGEKSETALEILDKRYARGEIEKQEYEEKKAAITRTG
jgi:putative membrane protein